MSIPDDDPHDDDFAALLATYDEGLAHGCAPAKLDSVQSAYAPAAPGRSYRLPEPVGVGMAAGPAIAMLGARSVYFFASGEPWGASASCGNWAEAGMAWSFWVSIPSCNGR